MSSSIDNLFGNVDSSNIDSTVSKLFSSSSGPIDNLKVKNKSRTVIADSKKNKDVEVSQEEKSEESTEEVDEEPVKKRKKLNKDEDGDVELEDRYYAKLAGDESGEEDANQSVKDETPISKKEQKAKKIDLKEDELEKADRTIFVGNISSDVIASKKTYKEFKKLFSTNPLKKEKEGDDDDDGKKENEFAIDSIRFRSISFDEALPRKVAFVQQKLHKSRESVNAYVVYKNKNVVKSMCSNLNGHIFASRHLRVDSVAHPASHDNKRSVFVGNLDFEEDDERLWRHFESCGEVDYVRIVRDSKTNLGKGFAYIQFKDFQSVNKALLLNDKPISSDKTKGKNRKLRVDRCKNIRKPVTPSGGSSFKQRAVESRLNESNKTKFGRAKKILGKADRATLGQEITVEGLRASKGAGPAASHLKKKKQRSKTGRVTKRSQAFRKTQA